MFLLVCLRPDIMVDIDYSYVVLMTISWLGYYDDVVATLTRPRPKEQES